MTSPLPGCILIVDDNEMNRDICCLHLEELDMVLLDASNGEKALDIAEKSMPDLILLDLMMPGIDGFEVLKRLKKQKKLQDIPVLILTAKTETNSIVKALELGASDYLKKPFDGEELIARSKNLLKTRFLEKQMAEDLEAGAKIQKTLFADLRASQAIFDEFNYEIDIYSCPFSAVTGDFYHCFNNTSKKPGLFIGDSCGHGLSAALISIRIIGFLHQYCSVLNSPAEINTELNKIIIQAVPHDKFIACATMFFNEEEVVFSNAAQPYPLLLRNGKVQEIIFCGFAAGMDEAKIFEEISFPFLPGDTLVLYTDGLVEIHDKFKEIYGKDRLIACIENTEIHSPKKLRKHILSDIAKFTKDSVQEDDISLIVIYKKPNQENSYYGENNVYSYCK